MVHFTNLLMLVIFVRTVILHSYPHLPDAVYYWQPYWNAVNWAFSSVADIILTSRILFNLRKTLASKTDMDECMPQLPLYKDLPPLPPPSPPSKRSSAFAGPSQDKQGLAVV
ncbi:hypothetical protein BC629DRAFT_1535207 [Irpex lacteus]|nr:hypothetical protein BC629DRAFT_1535207 [Irpex lacteus]